MGKGYGNYYEEGFSRCYDQGIMGEPLSYDATRGDFPSWMAWNRFCDGCEEGFDAGQRDARLVAQQHA